MQQRHLDRWQYFTELANTSRKYYIDYLKSFLPITSDTKVLEIGCGEGGNLLPFAELGCYVKGIDLNAGQIENAKNFFAKEGQNGDFCAENFLNYPPEANESKLFDVVMVHDCIEHIEPDGKKEFFLKIAPLLRQNGVVFFAFPAWQMPFGGHQQICQSKISKIPFIHLLPVPLYRGLLRSCKEKQSAIDELLSIKRSKMPVEKFERLAKETGYETIDKQLWFINPHYEQKFHLKPRKLNNLIAKLPWIRNFFTTSAFYLLKYKN